jgi:NADP-dependent 3-hydroxy acid dehydrogenase YdfG
MNMTRLAIPALKKSSGDIVNVASIAAKSPVPGSAVYSGTKAAVSNFSEALRKELIEEGIRVVTIYPGFVETEFFDNAAPEKKEVVLQAMAKIGPLKAQDLADVITFAVTRPPNVSLNEIVIRPTKQVV